MAKISRNDFISGLQKSGIVASDRLATLIEETQDAPPEAIANRLIRENLATKWQAKYLLSGRSLLDIGSYRLLERIQIDEFGDRFFAVQTSLARHVDLRVLPKSLTQDRASCARFIQKASHAAKLDHPNLTHVYDIDQEGGRYYLVTEHVEGKTLDEIDASSFSASTIARIVTQAIDGITYAHRHNVVHGFIGPTDVLLDNQNQLKIQRLPLSPLRQQNTDSQDQPTKEQDFVAIAKIGAILLRKTNNIEPTHRSELTDAFIELGNGSPESVRAATITLADIIAVAPAGRESDVASLDQPIRNTQADEEKKPTAKSNNIAPKKPVKLSYVGRLKRDNPVAFVATLLVMAAILVGGSVYGAFSILGNPKAAARSQVERTLAGSNETTKKTPIQQSHKASMNQTTLTNPDNDQAKRPRENEGTNEVEPIETNQRAGESQTTLAENDVNSEPIRISPEIANPSDNQIPPGGSLTNPNDEGGLDESVDGRSDDVPAEDKPQPPKLNTDLTEISGIGPANQRYLKSVGVESLEQIARMSPEQLLDALVRGGRRQAISAEDCQDFIVQAKDRIGDESPVSMSPVGSDDSWKVVSQAIANGPFADFPGVVELPAIEDTSETLIADLEIRQQYLLGAELICEKGAAKGRTTFEFERADDDKQKWIVSVKKTPNHNSTPIAAFRKSDNGFHFQWFPAASTDNNASKLAPYLRNCFLKLFLPDEQATILTLREPMRIKDLRLTEHSLSNQVEFLIPAMPSPESIVVEVLPLRIKNVVTKIPNSRIERNNPARIWMKKDDKTGFLWIQVTGELRTKLKIQSNLTLLFQGTAQSVRNLKSLSELAATVDAAAVRSQLTLDQLSKPVGMKTADFDKKKSELTKDANAKQAIKEKLITYAEILPKILNQPINVRVYAKLGNFQTILAISDPTIPQVED